MELVLSYLIRFIIQSIIWLCPLENSCLSTDSKQIFLKGVGVRLVIFICSRLGFRKKLGESNGE